MMRVFTPRRIITNRIDIADDSLGSSKYSLDGEDVKKLHKRIKKLKRQVTQLTIGKAETDQEYMNILSSMEKEKDHELNLMSERVKEFEESNSFLKVSKNSLVDKVLDLERNLASKQKVLDKENSRIQGLVEKVDTYELQAPTNEEEKGNDDCDQDQVSTLEKLKNVLSSNVHNKAVQEAVQQLYTHAINQMAEKYNSEVKRGNSLEERIQIIMAREVTTNQRLAKIKQDADDWLLKQNTTIDDLKKELNSYKENKIVLERELLSTAERSGDGGTIKLLTRQLLLKNSEYIYLHKILEEKEKEVKELIECNNNSITHSSEEQDIVIANLLEQIQQKDAVIDQMTRVANDLLSCKENVSEQKSITKTEGLKYKLQQKNAKIECIYFKKEKNVVSREEWQADFHRIIQKYQYNLKELDEMHNRHKVEWEQNIKKNQIRDQILPSSFQKDVEKHEEFYRNQCLDIDELSKKLTNGSVPKCETEANVEENNSEGIVEETETKSLISTIWQKMPFIF